MSVGTLARGTRLFTACGAHARMWDQQVSPCAHLSSSRPNLLQHASIKPVIYELGIWKRRLTARYVIRGLILM